MAFWLQSRRIYRSIRFYRDVFVLERPRHYSLDEMMLMMMFQGRTFFDDAFLAGKTTLSFMGADAYS